MKPLELSALLPARTYRQTYIVMLDELPTATDANAKGTEHALVLAKVRFPVFLVLHVHGEGFALEEDFKIAVMLENRVRRNLVQHPLKGSPPRLDEVRIETAHRLLLWRRGDNNTGVVVVHRIIEPKEVTVSAADSKLRLSVGFGGRLYIA